MNADQLHFEKYLLEQSKKRPKVKTSLPEIIPIDCTMDAKTSEYIYFMSSDYRDKLFYELFKITEA